jgi:hypothetical protein
VWNTVLQQHFNERRLTFDEDVTVPTRTDKKPFRRKPIQRMDDEHKLTWLNDATDQLLQLYDTVGTLTEGKWHEAFSLFNAWSNYRKDSNCNAAYRMESIFNMLAQERIHQNNTNINITIHTYNKLMDAWACAALFHTIPNPIAASQRLHDILLTLQHNFDTSTHSTILPSSQPPKLLLANNTTTDSVPIILPLQPNAESFHIVLYTVCRVEGVLVARRLLGYMEHWYRTGRNPNAHPTRSQYIHILDAYAQLNSETSTALAEAFLRHLKYNFDLQRRSRKKKNNNIGSSSSSSDVIPLLPDTLCYNIVIRAWSRHRRGRAAAEHADRLLEEMKEAASDHCRPDIITYGCTYIYIYIYVCVCV